MDNGQRLNVLVADATTVGRQLAAFLIGKRGHTVHAVVSAADLFARLDATIDLILVHIPLPDADADAVAHEVRQRAPHAALFALADAPADGFDETLASPLTPAALDDVLQKLVLRIVDVPKLMRLMGDNRGLLRKMMEVLEPTIESGLAGMKAAIAASDAPSLMGLGHRLKGALGNFAADEAVAAAKTLELMGKAGDLTAARAALAKLENAVTRVRAELQAIAAE
jgi:two-component system sensor histidine kinase/response regulator